MMTRSSSRLDLSTITLLSLVSLLGTSVSSAEPMSREAALAGSPRIAIDSPIVRGSISLKGGRIDDLALARYHETIDPNSPAIVLLSPSGSRQPYYAEFGWVGAADSDVKAPGPNAEWRQEGSGTLGIGHPVTLVYDNTAGLIFRRTISVDDKYLFTIRDEVNNAGMAPVTLYPYALVSRHGTPQTLGLYILHEGLIGVLGDLGLQEVSYETIDKQKAMSFKISNAWLGITDRYWATALLPNTNVHLDATFEQIDGTPKRYQAKYLLDAQIMLGRLLLGRLPLLLGGVLRQTGAQFVDKTARLHPVGTVSADPVDAPPLRRLIRHDQAQADQRPTVADRQRHREAHLVAVVEINQALLPLFSWVSSSFSLAATSSGCC